MLGEVFYWLFNMSITAALTGTVVLLIRRCLNIPGRVRVWLWVIPFLRMLCPIGLNSPYSLMALLARITTKTVVVYQPAEEVSFSVTNCVMAADSYFPITFRVNTLERVFRAAGVLWLIICAAILFTLTVLYVTTIRELRDAERLYGNVYLSEKVSSPAVYGIVRAKIVLPRAYAGRDNELILLHERTHIRRGDNFRRLAAYTITALHWFNPLAWVFLNKLLADMELACDECVLASLAPGRTKEYASLLLDSAAGVGVFASDFGGAGIRIRIEHILSFKKMTVLSAVVFGGLSAVIFYVLLTNAG